MRWRALAFLVVLGCGGKDTDDSGSATGGEMEAPEIHGFTLDPTSGPVGTLVTSTVMVAHFALTGEEGDHGEEHDEHDMDEHHEGGHGMEMSGHVHIYIDDLMTEPVLMQMTEAGEFTIADDLAVGSHTVIARLHGADHTIIEPQVTAEATFEVTE